MIYTASPENVVMLLGDKPMELFRTAVDGAREDYNRYVSAFPVWAAQDCGRMTFNLIHERIWHRVVDLSEDIDGLDAVEQGTTRNLHIGSQFQIRFKLHDSAGGVVSYPTQTALEFWAEPPATLPSMECVSLAVGYEWDKDLATMGRAVMSLHVSMDKPLWVIELPRFGEEGTGDISVIQGPIDGPQLPTIVMPGAPARETGRG